MRQFLYFAHATMSPDQGHGRQALGEDRTGRSLGSAGPDLPTRAATAARRSARLAAKVARPPLG